MATPNLCIIQVSSNTASRSPRSAGVQAAEGYLLENDPRSGSAAQLGAEKVSTRSFSPSAPEGTAEAATSARKPSSNTTSRSPRSVGVQAAEGYLLENDPRSGSAAQLRCRKGVNSEPIAVGAGGNRRSRDVCSKAFI